MRPLTLTLSLVALVIIVGVPLGAAFGADRAAVVPDAVLLEAAVTPAALMAPWPEAGVLAVTGGLLLGLASLVRGRP